MTLLLTIPPKAQGPALRPHAATVPSDAGLRALTDPCRAPDQMPAPPRVESLTDPAAWDRFVQTAADLQEALMTFLSGQRPPFGTSKLAAWMKTAFATEMAREKARLDSFAQIGRPSVLGGQRRASVPEAAPAASMPPRLPRVPPPRAADVSTEELDADARRIDPLSERR